MNGDNILLLYLNSVEQCGLGTNGRLLVVNAI